MQAEAVSLPFNEAITFFRSKLNMPSNVWADMLHSAHTRGFTVAGATKDALLVDLRAAVDKAIATGTTLDEFRKDFDKTVAANGWDYNGGRGWRTKVIYQTNLRTAYAAGRYQQMKDPDVVRYQPFWKYVHSDLSIHPRPEHLAWNGLVLDHDDPWWSTHYPPNGWGCKCSVEPISRRELKAMKKTGPDKAPPLDLQKATLNTSVGKMTLDVPKGVDPGWGYRPGATDEPLPIAEEQIAAWAKDGGARWRSQTPGDWQTAGRPKRVPVDASKTPIGDTAVSKADLVKQLEAVIGGAETAFPVPSGDVVTINAAALGNHLDLDRAQFLPLIPEILSDPYEIWGEFAMDTTTGRQVLRRRIVKAIDTGKGRSYMLLIQSVAGRLEAWTFVPSNRADQINRAWRVGELLWSRADDEV